LNLIRILSATAFKNGDFIYLSAVIFRMVLYTSWALFRVSAVNTDFFHLST
jgi:hypothetical protein